MSPYCERLKKFNFNVFKSIIIIVIIIIFFFIIIIFIFLFLFLFLNPGQSSVSLKI